ncbi:apolipoprotein A-IV-like [Anguilla anguilla]|uniref:apolipoprotein A-IV-like n=1 Tax=Anguilla anguilla TaxID=7936 RepID=UPI0015B16B7F|nr:apolipoprotein A-IV-like [Anguilla anguilla]
MAMKLFVALALVAFTGCQANVLRSDEPKPQLDLVKDAFWDYFVKATKIVLDTLKTIGNSASGQQVNEKITESVEVASQYRAIVQDQVVVFSQELHKKLSEHVEQLSESLQPDINEVRVQLEPLAEKLSANIQQQMQKVRQVLDPYTEPLDTRNLKRALQRMHGKLIRTLFMSVDQLLSHLHSQLSPSTKELKGKVEESVQEYKKFVLPLKEILNDEIFNKVLMYDRTLYPYVKGLRAKLDPYIQGLESQLTALWESSAKSA